MKTLLSLLCLTIASSATAFASPSLVGWDVDIHGCKASAGYSWNATKNACTRPWEDTMNSPSSLVEQDIISMQQDAVKIIRNVLANYLSKDQKQTGNLDFSIKLDSEFGSGSARLTLDKYINILSVVSWNQEADYEGRLHVNFTSTWAPSIGSSSPEALSGDILFSVNTKIIGDDLYVTLGSFSVSSSMATLDVQEALTLLKSEVTPFIWKTLHIKNIWSELNGANILQKTNAVLQVLETQSLFSVQSKIKNGYKLKLKESTFRKLNKALGTKSVKTLTGINFNKWVIFYEKIGNVTSLSLREINKFSKNSFTLQRENGAYTFDAVGVGKWYAKGNYFSLHWEKDSLSFRLHDESADIQITYQNNALYLSAKWEELTYTNNVFGSVTHTLLITGTTDLETANLVIDFDGQRVGNIVSIKSGNMYTKTIHLNMKPDEKTSLIIDLLENVTLEFGTFTVEKPKNVIELTDFE